MNSPNSNLPSPSDKRESVQTMFDRISGRYDLVNRIMTFRLDVRWRKRLVAEMDLAPQDLILDLACGTGDFAAQLNSTGFRSIGIDLSSGMLENASSDFVRVQGDLLELPIASETVDGCVCGFALRNLVELESFFTECARVLRPGGVLGVLEVSEPKSKILSTGHDLYFNKLVPKIGALLSDRSAYAYLPESVEYLPETKDIETLMTKSGFSKVRSIQLSGGIAQLLLGTRA